MPGVDRYTGIMLHCNGTAASTIFTDSSTSALTFVSCGGATLQTSNPKFGSAAGGFDGTGLTGASDHAMFNVGTGDFTIDFWAVITSTNALRYFWGQGDSGGFDAGFWCNVTAGTNVAVFSVSTGGSSASAQVTSSTAVSTGAYMHFAMVRTGSTLMMFFNGAQRGGNVAFAGTVHNSAGTFSVGAIGGLATNRWLGLIDEFRFSPGIARWTADFTPPTVAYDEWLTDYGAETSFTSISEEDEAVGY